MSIDDLIGKKGNYQILKMLKFKALNYNTIKKRIIENFSARTLDFRLKELTNSGLLNRKILNEIGPIRIKYSLTNKGLIILTCFEVLEQLIAGQILPEEFQKEFSLKLTKNANLNFDKVWRQLKNILEDKKILYTLNKENPNKLLMIDDTGITVETSKGEDKIPISNIKEAWINFVEKGSLQQNEHKLATYRSSFILALFSQLPFVKVDKGPPLTIIFDPIF